ncbi:MAG TPA: tryptophan synthase subunit alpha [Dictyobacter sp.]|nr:tryptophan synthase subunit alpha [Dictyobacter sp.]
MGTMSTNVARQQGIPAQKITQAFQQAKKEGRSVLIPYFMCGYPSATKSAEIILAAAEGGADIIELGMPFSDPLADGPTIQHAGQIALNNGMTVQGCMEIAKEVSSHCDVPLLLMGYYNPLLAYGLERFCTTAIANGVSGLIIPDLPPEEADELQAIAYRHGLGIVYLVPPTTPDKRIANVVQRIAAGPGSFLYCISLSGVTGERAKLPPHLQSFITRVRSYVTEYNIPLAIGFGISKPEHIVAVSKYAEGAVVGSALINLIDQQPEAEQTSAIKSYIKSLAQK